MNLKYANTFEALPCAVRTATVTGAAVDLKDYHGQVLLSLISSVATASDTLNAKVQDSADGSTGWADVTGAVWTEVDDQADAYETIAVDVDKIKRHIRIVGTLAGGSISMAFGVSGVGFKQHQTIQQ